MPARHHRHHAAREPRLAQRALGPQEVGHLGQQLVHVRVLGRQTDNPHSILQPLVEVRRAFAARLRIDEVAHRGGPGRFETVLDFGEVVFGQPVERIGAALREAICLPRTAASIAATLMP